MKGAGEPPLRVAAPRLEMLSRLSAQQALRLAGDPLDRPIQERQRHIR